MTIKQIKQWFELAKPNPTEEDVSAQVGVHFSEVGEMVEAIGLGAGGAFRELMSLEEHYLRKRCVVTTRDDEELLDSLCDQIVTAIGVAHMKGYDIEGALQEVARSNDSKFVNGKPIFNEHGKIMKGPSYSKPDLKPFIGK
jgi:NTP pyrophosphatase (non-canonical NTP hydrolase)